MRVRTYDDRLECFVGQRPAHGVLRLGGHGTGVNARQALSLESAIDKLDKYQELILEDLCYVRKIKLRSRSCSN
jgi:hypothetical protein